MLRVIGLEGTGVSERAQARGIAAKAVGRSPNWSSLVGVLGYG